jgi:hypothetical protein
MKNGQRAHFLENSSAIHEEKIEHNRSVKVHELLVTFKLFGCNARSGIKETLTT